jgi:hemin uptake protein HemP
MKCQPAIPENARQEIALTGAPGKATQPTARTALARVSSAELLGRAGEIIIEHQGREYRLRLTQNGKLILTA